MSTTVPALGNNSALNSYIQQQQQAAAAAQAAQAATNGTSSTNSTGGATSLEGLSGNFNTFLQILTTQLTNQDPTDATDTNQFTQELVEFSQVEQQLNTNSDLQTLIGLQQNSTGLNVALGYVGSVVEAPSASQLPLQGGEAELAYTLPSAAASVAVNITDANGNTVATLTAPTTAGLDRVAWDGYNSSGTQEPDGVYNFTLTATDANGNSIPVTDTRAVGVVTSVSTGSTAGTINLSLGTGMTVSASTVDTVWPSSAPPTATLGDPGNNPNSSSTSNSSTNNSNSSSS